jgi:serine/threonine-protein kinase
VSELEKRLARALREHYQIERELGRGGMARVYLARDRRTTPVAIKVVHPELVAAGGVERFLREIEIAARLSHPHILGLLDSGHFDAGAGRTLPYYIMPFVDGESLRARIDRERRLPVSDALRIAGEVAQALHYAHQQGVIHRDIKPENILLHAGSALVTDFGIARAASHTGGRITETGLVMGTPSYMSPEQAAGERGLDARSDIYSLGCVLYAMLTGRPPFTGGTRPVILARLRREAIPAPGNLRPGLSSLLDRVVLQALAREPEHRFPAADAFAEALGAAASGEGQPRQSWRWWLKRWRDWWLKG